MLIFQKQLGQTRLLLLNSDNNNKPTDNTIFVVSDGAAQNKAAV